MTDILSNPQIVGALIALSGLLVGICSSWILAVINRRYDDRRHLREVAFSTAVENWKYVTEAARAANEPALPLDVYLLHMVKLSEILSEKHLNRQAIIARIPELREVINAGIELAKTLTADSEERARREN